MKKKNLELQARKGRRYLTWRGLRAAGFSVALMVGLMVGDLTGGAGRALADPDYGPVLDILKGQQHILRNDDLAVAYATFSFFNDGNSHDSNGAGTVSFVSTNSKLDYPSGGRFPLVKNGTGDCSNSAGCPNFWLPAYWQDGSLDDIKFQEGLAMGHVVGRFFNTDRDHLVQFSRRNSSDGGSPLLIWFTGDNTGNLSEVGHQEANQLSNGAQQFFAEVGDFNGDGYDDLILGSNAGGAIQLAVGTATDVNDPTQGFTFGNILNVTYGIRELAVGDFNGDGLSEAAYAYIAPNAHLYVQILYVDPPLANQPPPKQMQLHLGNTVDLKPDGQNLFQDYGYHPVTMAAGKFTSAQRDQLVVGHQLLGGAFSLNNYVDLYKQLVDFSGGATSPSSITPKLIYTSNPDPSGQFGHATFKLKAGRLNPASAYDQLVQLAAKMEAGTNLAVFTVDPTLNPNNPNFFNKVGSAEGTPPINSGRLFWAHDFAIGNFDHQQPSATNPNATEKNPKQQIALVGVNSDAVANEDGTYECGAECGNGSIWIFDVDPSTYQLTRLSSSETSFPNPDLLVPNHTRTYNYVPVMKVAAGDFRGRSYRVGAPTKITLQKAQPSVILAAPPMHADFLPTPATGISGLFNLSVIPDGYFSRYELDTTSSTTSTNTNTLDASFGAKLTGGFGIAIGDEDKGDGASLKDTFTTTADLKNSVQNQNGTFATTQFSINQSTGMTDQLWIKDSLFYVYSYPVLGRTACPAGQPNCADSAKLPLTVQFSVPAPSEIKTPPASNLEWYQPPWEYGNIFSYPASYSQLQAYVPDIQKLSEDVVFYTDASNIQVKNSWNTGSNASQTVSFNQNYSMENDLSFSVTEGLAGLGTGNVNGSFDISASVGLGKVQESSTSLAATTGITAQKPGSFAEPIMYAYAVKPVIFGRQSPDGSTGSAPSNGNINTFGLLQTAYIADPTDPSAGLWWSQAYNNKPDIALNHPNRWVVSTPGLSNPVPDNCRPTGTGASQMDCVDLAPSAPTNPWLSEVHYMRGFFITSNNFPNYVTPGQGPQLTMATEGDKLIFSTRVYNYSLNPMSSGSNLYVRFYGTTWNPSTQYPVGKVFQIGADKVVPALPGFNATPGAPLNWVMVNSDVFDTTDFKGDYLAFFVVVWGQNSDGSLVSEAYGHGLQGAPGSQGAINYFSDLVELEELVAVNGNSVSFSNNIGFYNAPMYIAPSGAPSTDPNPNLTSLKVSQVQTSKKSAKASSPIVVSTLIKAGKQPINKLMVEFYDGNPKFGGQLFDMERIPYIKPRSTYRSKVIFRSNYCGKHNIHVKVADGKPYAASSKSRSVLVKCPKPKPRLKQ